MKVWQAQRQHEAVEAIRKLGGLVEYDWEFDTNHDYVPRAQPPGPAWLRSMLGDDLFQSIDSVDLTGSEATNVALEHIEVLSQLRWLYLGRSQVTDTGSEHLKGLSQLKLLTLYETHVTDAGLRNIKGLSELKVLGLDDTQVTDAGLDQLRGMGQLQELYLEGTQVTDAGVAKLRQVLPHCKIQH